MINVVGQQMKFFANYTRNQEVIKFLERFRHKAKISFIEQPDQIGVMHMLASLAGNITENCGYLFIHNDNLSEAQVKALEIYTR